jgi:hypothetical protein
MMNILFLSQSAPGFSTLRSNHMRNFLEQQTRYTIHEVSLTAQNIYDEQIQVTLHSLSTYCDVIVTAGPFLPALVIPYLDTKTPLWMDWPSDPLADGLSKYAIQKNINWTEIRNAVQLALSRSDAFGVISQRSKDALIGQLMLLGRVDTDFFSKGVFVTPIVCDFPESIYIPTDDEKENKETFDILICGSLNTWFDVQTLCNGLDLFLNASNEMTKKIHLHIVGVESFCSYSSEGWKTLENWIQGISSDTITVYPWLEEEDFENVLKKCDVGVWMDKSGIEPYLGSRTRALFYAWRGLDIIGGGACELVEDLSQHGEIHVASSMERLAHMLTYVSSKPMSYEKKKDRIERLKNIYGLEQVFAPLQNWLQRPTQRKHFLNHISQQEQITNLQQELYNIYNSTTWKVLSSIHKKFRSLKSS